MLRELEIYYQTKDILSTAFRCPHRRACSKNSPDYTEAKSAFVGSAYERGDLPRLLFVSLDSGSAEPDPVKRTPVGVRDENETRFTFDAIARHKNRHWYRTHELAQLILSRFRQPLDLRTVARFFAHANSAKCCQNLPHRAQAHSVLFSNCREFLDGELQILRPHVLVTQGEKARRAVEPSTVGPSAQEDGNDVSVVTIHGRRVIWLHTPHPNRRGPFYSQRRGSGPSGSRHGWERLADLIWLLVARESDWKREVARG